MKNVVSRHCQKNFIIISLEVNHKQKENVFREGKIHSYINLCLRRCNFEIRAKPMAQNLSEWSVTNKEIFK